MKGARGLVLTLAALAVVLAVFEATALDLAVQDRLYDFDRGAWVVDGKAPLPRLVFYRGPKAALAAVGVALLVVGLVGGWERRRFGGPRSRVGRAMAPREAFYLFACLATVPLLVGLGKRFTGVYCPYEIERYGGTVPYYRLIDPVPEAVEALKRGRCFPAAHASGGLALVALAFVGRRRLASALWGIAIGGVMGAYQMARGAHYLSHTLVSLLLAWLVALVLARAFALEGGKAPSP